MDKGDYLNKAVKRWYELCKERNLIIRMPFLKDKKVGFFDFFPSSHGYYHGDMAYVKSTPSGKRMVVYRCGTDVTKSIERFDINELTWTDIMNKFSDPISKERRSVNIGIVNKDVLSIKELFDKTEKIFDRKERKELSRLLGNLYFIKLPYQYSA